MTTLDTVRVTVVGVPVVNEVSQDQIITLIQLENLVGFGLTFGAWFRIGMAIALLLLILERLINFVQKLRGLK